MRSARVGKLGGFPLLLERSASVYMPARHTAPRMRNRLPALAGTLMRQSNETWSERFDS